MRKAWTLALLGTAFFVVILDSTIVYVALPPMARDLGLDPADAQWVLSTYLVTFGGLLLFGGRVADLLGRRRIFLVGIGMFTIASLLCGIADDPALLLGARVLQGAGAAVMAPTALSLVLITFGPGPERNRALGVWGGIGGVGGTAGLLLGGPITHAWGWPWIFLVNVPVGLALLAASMLLLRESRDLARPRTFDVAGAASVTASLVLLVLAITTLSWPTFAAAAVLMLVFVAVESRSTAPLVPLRVVRSRRLIGGNGLLLVAGMCVDGALLVLTLHAQHTLGMSPVQFGLTTAAMTGMSVVGSLTGQAVVTRGGVRPVAVAGMLLLALGCLALAAPALPIVAGLLVFGAGLGAAFVAAQIAAVSGAPDADSGLAAGIADTSFTIGGALGVAILSTVGDTRTALLVAAALAVLGLVATLVARPGRRARATVEAALGPP